MKFAVVIFPGSNCDVDCLHVIKDVLGQPVEAVWHQQDDLSGYDAVILPGGFSYGDYLRTGSIARFSPIMGAVVQHANQGKPTLGICNGFQILLEAGLLPGAMLRNDNLQFRCHDQFLIVENNQTLFTTEYQRGQVINVPIAHAEGNYYAPAAAVAELEANGQVVFRYCDAHGRVTQEANPNGSSANIAGIVNKKGNVLGMMPHPERAAEVIMGSEDGRLVFTSLLKEWRDRNDC